MRRPGTTTAPAPGEDLDAVLAEVVRGTGAAVGLAYVLPPAERVLRIAVVSGVVPKIAAPWARIALDDPIPVADAVRERRLVWLASQEEVARRYPRLGIVLPYDFMLAAAPFAHEGRVWGGVVLLWPTWHPPSLSAPEREAVDAGCRRAGALLHEAARRGAPLFTGDEPRVLMPPRSPEPDPEEARAALDFAQRIPVGCCALDMDGRITFINTTAAELVGAGGASLRGARPWEALLWMNDPVFEDQYRAAVITRQATSFTALRPPDRWLSFHLYPDDRGISVQITPLTGVPGEDPVQPERLPSVGPGGAGALYHLMHLAAALTETAGVSDVVEAVADQLVPAFGPRGLAIMTMEECRLRIIGYRGYSKEFMDSVDGSPLTAQTPTVHALTAGVPSFFGSFDELRSAYPGAVRYEQRDAWAFLPLIASGRPVGSLVLSYDRSRPFPPAERATLTSLAGLIAQALDRARLYDTTQQLAHTLQTALLPHSLPAVPGLDVAARYLPAGQGVEIGGDFYDLIRCDATTTAATIGDVQGHNIQAAALMGQVRTAVHAHATAGTPPSDVLARTNRLLCDLEPGLFTSCLYAQLDLAGHRARIATAGHPPPLVLHPDGRTEAVELPPGLLLGIDPDAVYSTVEIPFPPGTVVVLHTDGLVETAGTDIDEATAAVCDCLARARDRTADELADTLVRHATGVATRNDDIALLVIRHEAGGRQPRR
ncbi:SpoIIE family protein phosphatase [Streptomyces wuyuanensis]|uniref:protein-serine/threonine phosphatase n=1 Tax=Streptomyces wuyuanensis TaxID=1196353 RepID=A0A1G9XRN7_9ACTN|nr:SpoIIE family protein phosphatase [Streptomyces wuyuanensis]SDM99181.1 PAS fold-containing protein [Streptomyces wuyuanensis]